MLDDPVLQHCRDPGFTPGRRHVARLIELWTAGDRNARKLVVKALSRGDANMARVLLEGLQGRDGPERAMRIRVVGRIHATHAVESLEDMLPGLLADSEPAVVREAARLVGRLSENAERFERALLDVCEGAARPERKAAVWALGRVGTPRSEPRLAQMSDENDAELRRTIDEALVLLRRRASREQGGRIVEDRGLEAACVVVFRYRADVGAVVRDQLGDALEVETATATSCTARFVGPLAVLRRARSALDVGLRFELPPGGELADRVVRGLEAAELLRAVRTWTDGPVRFRLLLRGAGRRRAQHWRIARALDRLGSPLVNDSRGAAWTFDVDPVAGRILCIPRSDPRFPWRVADVPAASHPTLAATLAWLAAPRPGERIWDPFCGSASELLECVRLCPAAQLRGTDLDEAALSAARRNVAAAGLSGDRIELVAADALVDPGPPATLVVTNPPMGRRVARDGNLKPLLRRFVDRLAHRLTPGGRMVWVTPLPQLTARAATGCGLEVEDLGDFDMGGFTAGLQRIRRS